MLGLAWISALLRWTTSLNNLSVASLERREQNVSRVKEKEMKVKVGFVFFFEHRPSEFLLFKLLNIWKM